MSSLRNENSGSKFTRIISHKFIGRSGKVMYKVLLVGYPESEAKWEQEKNIENAKEAIAEYWDTHPEAIKNAQVTLGHKAGAVFLDKELQFRETFEQRTCSVQQSAAPLSADEYIEELHNRVFGNEYTAPEPKREEEIIFTQLEDPDPKWEDPEMGEIF